MNKPAKQEKPMKPKITDSLSRKREEKCKCCGSGGNTIIGGGGGSAHCIHCPIDKQPQAEEFDKNVDPKTWNTPCPVCGRKYKPGGINQHLTARHQKPQPSEDWEKRIREKIDGIEAYNYSELTNDIIQDFKSVLHSHNQKPLVGLDIQEKPITSRSKDTSKNWKEYLYDHFGYKRHTTNNCDHTLEEVVEEIVSSHNQKSIRQAQDEQLQGDWEKQYDLDYQDYRDTEWFYEVKELISTLLYKQNQKQLQGVRERFTHSMDCTRDSVTVRKIFELLEKEGTE